MSESKEMLQSFIERIERLEDEKRGLSDDVKDVYAEAKSQGFDVKGLRTVIKLRRMDKIEREKMESIVDTYLQQLGMV